MVTGGAGFIGHHLTRELLERGRRVRVVDDFSTGRRERVNPRAELLEGDVNDVADAAVKDAEVIYHLGALPSVPRSIEKPLESHRASASSTLALLAAAERAGARRLVLASSSSVYGNTATLPKREDMPPAPLSPYAAAKLAAELYCAGWAGKLETVALRFFNVYGPGQDPTSAYAAVIPIFISSLLAGRPMPVNGDGGQTRDFTFVGDLVKGIADAGDVPGLSRKVYNVAGGAPVSVLEMGRALAELLGRPADFDFRPPREGDVRDSFADATAARRDFGFECPTSLRTGLRLTLGSYR